MCDLKLDKHRVNRFPLSGIKGVTKSCMIQWRLPFLETCDMKSWSLWRYRAICIKIPGSLGEENPRLCLSNTMSQRHCWDGLRKHSGVSIREAWECQASIMVGFGQGSKARKYEWRSSQPAPKEGHHCVWEKTKGARVLQQQQQQQASLIFGCAWLVLKGSSDIATNNNSGWPDPILNPSSPPLILSPLPLLLLLFFLPPLAP